MNNINLNFIQLEQGIKNLIAQSQLHITVVDSILEISKPPIVPPLAVIQLKKAFPA